MPKKKTTTKKKSTVNKAGNYTKPTMRKIYLIELKPVAKVESRVNGLLVKLRCWLNNTKLKVVGINREFKKFTKKS